MTRRIPATDPAVVTVTRIAGGTTGNVIPETVELQGTIRALSERSRELAHEGLHQVVEGIGQAHGVEATANLALGYPSHRQRRGLRVLRPRRGPRASWASAASSSSPRR